MTATKPTVILFFILCLVGCSTSITDYKPQSQAFDLKTYFTGDVIAWGMIQDHAEKVTRRFCVELNGSWQGNEGLLAEKFYFDDGEITYRDWQLTKQADGSYLGEAADVIGTAIGKYQGFAFNLTYTLLLPVDDTTYEVSMDDWMYQMDQYRVINKTAISKFGVNVASVTLFFDKQLPVKTCTS